MSVIEYSTKTIRPASTPDVPLGSIVTIKLRGHRETDGEDYYAPAFVLGQWSETGDLKLFVLDVFNTGYKHAVPYETVGTVLFDAGAFAAILQGAPELQARVLQLEQMLADLKQMLDSLTRPSMPDTDAPKAQTGGSGLAVESMSKPARR